MGSHFIGNTLCEKVDQNWGPRWHRFEALVCFKQSYFLETRNQLFKLPSVKNYLLFVRNFLKSFRGESSDFYVASNFQNFFFLLREAPFRPWVHENPFLTPKSRKTQAGKGKLLAVMPERLDCLLIFTPGRNAKKPEPNQNTGRKRELLTDMPERLKPRRNTKKPEPNQQKHRQEKVNILQCRKD